MKQMKWFYAAAAALLIAGCGGSDSGSDPVTPPPPPPPPPPVSASGYDVKLIAGQTVYADHEPLDRAVGCVDGPAIGAKINPTAKLYDNMARGPGGELFYADRGLCDGLVRVRAVDAANDTLKTVAVGVSNRADEVAPLTSFNWVTSLAASPDGELYVADSDTFSGGLEQITRRKPGRGPGIWRIAKDGSVSVLAGISLPHASPGVDGVGAGASFGYLTKLCYGADDHLYVNNNSRLTRVGLDGTVSTVRYEGGLQAYIISCGSDGGVLVHRRFEDARKNDVYEVISGVSVVKAPELLAPAFMHIDSADPVLVRGERESVVLTPLKGGDEVRLADQYRADGGSVPIDLESSPPTLGGPVRYGAAHGAGTFDLLTDRSVFRFTKRQ